MKRYLVWAAIWLITLIAAVVVGVNFGIGIGLANFHNQRVRPFQMTVYEVAEESTPDVSLALRAAADFAGTLSEMDRFDEAVEEFRQAIKSPVEELAE
ncbi:MAG: hypothetical protein KDN20_25220 [Verrucomicrobiae bacterium]|nr:hypothetical protein [Verrucomicrobiae bacterium]